MRLSAALFLLLFTVVPALAQGGNPSNIGLGQYPAAKCAVPPPADAAAPQLPAAENPSELEAALYNRRMRAYNQAMLAHNDARKVYAGCVEAYLAAARADIARIEAAIDATMAVANAQ